MQYVVYYDGSCRLCEWIKSLLCALDRGRRIYWIPYQALSNLPKDITVEDMERNVLLEIREKSSSDSVYYRGFYAFRKLSMTLMPLWPLALILLVPGVDLLGAKVYDWVSRHRKSLCGP